MAQHETATRRSFLLASGSAVAAVSAVGVHQTQAATPEDDDRSKLQTGRQVREACRSGALDGQTSGLAPGFAQANLVVLPREHAYDFLMFCQKNPKPCPLLDVTAPGETAPKSVAPSADIRTDLPRYRVWKDGVLADEPTDIRAHWRDDFVSFIIGCSFTFESALLRAEVPVRHIELNKNVPMFRTNIDCEPAGVFRGPTVVSMRPMTPADAVRAVQITSRFPDVHGAPIHIALPESIGIADLAEPDFGDAAPVAPDEIPVFWACGVTAQTVLKQSKLPFVITHSPGCMFLTDCARRTARIRIGPSVQTLAKRQRDCDSLTVVARPATTTSIRARRWSQPK